jgi:hypothetical protein
LNESCDSILFPGQTKHGNEGHQDPVERSAKLAKGIKCCIVRALILMLERGSLIDGEGPEAQVSVFPSKLLFLTLVQ